MPDLTPKPFEIALVGIDGAGKTAIAQKLAEDLRNRGLACDLANWRSLIRGGASDEPKRIVTEIHAASQRLWFVGAKFDHPKPLLPAETGALLRHLAGIMPSTVGWASNDHNNLFSSFLLELSSDIFFVKNVEDRLLSEETIIIFDSYGLKPVTKMLCLARRQAEREADRSALAVMDAAESLVAEVYARWLQPRVGYFLEVDPAIAWERRRRQNKPALVEDLSILGIAGREGFISFQSELGRSYRAMTGRWGWKVVHNEEGGASVAAAAGSILCDLEAKDLIPQFSPALT